MQFEKVLAAREQLELAWRAFDDSPHRSRFCPNGAVSYLSVIMKLAP